jgi:hypothetical protein
LESNLSIQLTPLYFLLAHQERDKEENEIPNAGETMPKGVFVLKDSEKCW